MRQAVFVAILLVVVGAGCRRDGSSEDSDDPAVAAAKSFLEAVQYRDAERAWEWHVASTREGEYCRTGAFERVLERTREEKTELDCRDAAEVSPARRAEMADDAALLLQILQFTCEHPEGDCVDFQKETFESHLPTTDLWEQLGAFEVNRVVREGDGERVIYVDVEGRGDEGATHHRSLDLRRTDDGWRVATVFEGADD